jgi:hypothetical protein
LRYASIALFLNCSFHHFIIYSFGALRRCASPLRYGARYSLGPLRGLAFGHASASLARTTAAKLPGGFAQRQKKN